MEVNGIKVIKEPATIPVTSWKPYPVGIIFHYTAGCNDDIKGTLESNGFGGAQFCVGRDGKIRQYAEVFRATWHAREASWHYWGIEHTAYRGHCELTDIQLGNSTKLSAALVEYALKKWNVKIPLRKLVPPVTLAQLGERYGFLDHTDGPNAIEAGGAEHTWNDKGHTDGLYRWTWDKYFAAVETAESEEELDSRLDELDEGWKAQKDGAPLDPDWSAWKKKGYRWREDATSLPKAGQTPQGTFPITGEVTIL